MVRFACIETMVFQMARFALPAHSPLMRVSSQASNDAGLRGMRRASDDTRAWFR